ncbi:MAG TPA: anti-phage dCTP deaminase [Luteitalea sp.]|nr:anti-phage dCTP deaminase [Luteitalea sp.]
MAHPEIFIGIVGAAGTDHASVATCLSDALLDVAYRSEAIHVIELLSRLGAYISLPVSPEEERIARRMDAGDDFRNRSGRADALAALCITEIARRRETATGQTPSPAAVNTAYVLRSLKRTEEVELLRRIYGNSFFLLGAYAPREVRVSRLAEVIARSHHSPSIEMFREHAERIVVRDYEDASNPDGQRLRDTFALADVFVRADDPRSLREQIRRFINLLFGHPFHTPTRDESGMFLAHAAALRSAALPRQVGAAITTPDGSIIATGCNDVPKAGGGLYCEEDANDKRDHVRGWDFSDVARSDMTADLLRRLRQAGWLAKHVADESPEALVSAALDKTGPLRGSQMASVVEFGRVVHAEMDAITDAARRGVRTQGAHLYTTTFPCHNCARHIVASGLSRVVFIEPYPKSRALELHQDAIALEPRLSDGRVGFEPFVGIAPRLYAPLFRMTKRKESDGRATAWHPSQAGPKLSAPSPVYLDDEQMEILNFLDRLKNVGLLSAEGSSDV